jgi:hypothetical protein
MSGPKSTGGLVLMAGIRRTLKDGGYVRFEHSTGFCSVVSASGEWFTPIDGRSYQGFLRSMTPKLDRQETGSIEEKSLVIIWQNKVRARI